MAFRRRARVARYFGFDPGRLTAAELHAYDDLIGVVGAEEAIRAGADLSPEAVGKAVEMVTDDKLAAQVAAARAKLEQSRRTKGF